MLLPRKDYWAWVRACSAYVMNFGPNLTYDAHTAAKYMAPRQVITFPTLPGGHSEFGDLEKWFQTAHPGIRLDPIEVDKPSSLEQALETRIAQKDRYGQRQRPFYLQWPTEFPVITQEFGANPQIYSRWGFPGHEGIDFRATPNTDIFACAEGEVYQVHKYKDNHPYGIHVRIRHQDGYKTVYAHLAKAMVVVGQRVETGQVIGKADSTGASVGSHLHLSLKREGATERGETEYKKDILDPTPFLVWPETVSSKSLTKYGWVPGRCLFGAHGRIGDSLQQKDLEVIARARLDAVMLEAGETKETIERLRADNPSIFLAVRLTTDFSVDPVSADAFLRHVERDVGRLYRLGLRYFELHASPNLQLGGWQRSWRDGEEFSRWFIRVLEKLRAAFPQARFGFPGLSPGGFMSGWRMDAEKFLDEAELAVAAADWLGVHCYWTDISSLKSLNGGRLVEEYRRNFPSKLILVTEFQNPVADLDPHVRGQQYLEFYRMVKDVSGIGAIFAYAISANEGHDSVVWRTEEGYIHPIAQEIGDRGS